MGWFWLQSLYFAFLLAESIDFYDVKIFLWFLKLRKKKLSAIIYIVKKILLIVAFLFFHWEYSLQNDQCHYKWQYPKIKPLSCIVSPHPFTLLLFAYVYKLRSVPSICVRTNVQLMTSLVILSPNNFFSYIL